MGKREGRGKRGNRAVIPPWPARSPVPSPHTPGPQAARTEVAAELAEQPAPGQRSHSQAAVPVATTEQQLSVRGHCQGLPAHTTAWNPGAAQQSLHPDPVRRTTGEARLHRRPSPSETLARAFRAHPGPQPSVLLGVAHGGVFAEAEVVAYVSVIGQPAVGPQQPTGTHGHLGERGQRRAGAESGLELRWGPAWGTYQQVCGALCDERVRLPVGNQGQHQGHAIADDLQGQGGTSYPSSQLEPPACYLLGPPPQVVTLQRERSL